MRSIARIGTIAIGTCGLALLFAIGAGGTGRSQTAGTDSASTTTWDRMLKNPELNGHRSPQALIEHMETEKLVLWGWNPGGHREPIPISHQEFIDLMKVWVSGGTVCPQ